VLEKTVLEQGEAAIRTCLDRVPFLKIRGVLADPLLFGRRPDFVVQVDAPTGQHNLVVEAKSSGQPRVARQAIDQLRGYCEAVPSPYPVFLAPYIADATGRLCEQEGVGYVDLAGNCRLSFGQVYIEERGRENPYSERRELRSLYSPKSERILRALLTPPRKPWKVEDLAREADVSLGLVSKVKRILEQREWLDPESRGVRLLNPEAALVEWAGEYRYTRHRAMDFYSLASGGELEEQVVSAAEGGGIRVALTGFSAAVRYAPSVRYQRSMIYCGGATTAIVNQLQLKQVPSGANLTLIEPYDDAVFYRVEIRDGVPVASPVQTFLDLMTQAGRGKEAADALLGQVIRPSW
jgi:hypothetical protein